MLITYTVHHACNWYVILQGVDVITYHYIQIPTLKTGDDVGDNGVTAAFTESKSCSRGKKVLSRLVS